MPCGDGAPRAECDYEADEQDEKGAGRTDEFHGSHLESLSLGLSDETSLTMMTRAPAMQTTRIRNSITRIIGLSR